MTGGGVNLVFLRKKLQQLFEYFSVKLGSVPALDHGDEFLVFAEGRKNGGEG